MAVRISYKVMVLIILLIFLVLIPLYSKHINSIINLNILRNIIFIIAAVSVHHLALTLTSLGFIMYGGLFHSKARIDPFIQIVASILVFI